MRKREREKKQTTQNGHPKGVFGTHTRGVFGTSRRAGRWGRGRRGRVSHVVRGGSRSRRRDVVVFIHCTRRLIGCLVGALVGFSPRPCVHTQHVYSRTHRRSACGRHIASLRDGATRRTRSGRQAPLLVCAEFDVATAARGRVHAWEKSALARSSPVASSLPRRDVQSSSSTVALHAARR